MLPPPPLWVILSTRQQSPVAGRRNGRFIGLNQICANLDIQVSRFGFDLIP
jgi:hypothetical protein